MVKFADKKMPKNSILFRETKLNPFSPLLSDRRARFPGVVQ